MTAVDESPRRRGWGTWLGHYSKYFMLAAVVATAAANLMSHRHPFLEVAAFLFDAGAVAALLADLRVHSSHLCERCIHATPLDTESAVTRWRPALWLHHHWISLVLCAAVVTWDIIDSPSRGWMATIVLGVPVCLLFMVSIFAEGKHRQLYPWCPWCRWGDGGGEEVSPDVPLPALSK